MRTKSELHQRLGFGQAGGSESVFLLILAHGFACCVIPFTVRLFVQSAGFDQRLLNFPDPFGLEMDACVARSALISPVMYHAPVHCGSARMCFLFLPGAYRHARQE